jgi:hypothetical protein
VHQVQWHAKNLTKRIQKDGGSEQNPENSKVQIQLDAATGQET